MSPLLFQTPSEEALWRELVLAFVQSGRVIRQKEHVEFADATLEALRERQPKIELAGASK